MGSRHRDRSRDRDRRDRDKDRDRRRRERSRDRDRHRDRDRDRDRDRRRDRSRSRDRSRGRSSRKSEEKTPEPDGQKLLAETLATIAATRNFASLVAKQEQEEQEANMTPGIVYYRFFLLVKCLEPLCFSEEREKEERRRRRKTRWGGSEHDKTFIPGMPTILPSTLNKEQEEAYLSK